MRPAAVALLLLAAPAVCAQDAKSDAAVREKLDTIRFLQKLEAPAGGFAPAPGAKPGLRGTSAAVRALKYNGAKTPNAQKHAAFVMSCFDPKTGGFADAPGGKADVTLTSVGVMAAVELGVPKDRFRKALDYLQDNAKTFEEIRIAAAGVEAWGVADCPFDLGPWTTAGRDHLKAVGATDPREVGSAVALGMRLGATPGEQERRLVADLLTTGQRADGGWGKAGEKGSDLESTYRVMRAFYLLKEEPKLAEKVRAFVAKCRNADGGYGVAPGQPSTMSGVYYAAIVSKWLDEFGKK
jgi:prenyltransferase beta subunit